MRKLVFAIFVTILLSCKQTNKEKFISTDQKWIGTKDFFKHLIQTNILKDTSLKSDSFYLFHNFYPTLDTIKQTNKYVKVVYSLHHPESNGYYIFKEKGSLENTFAYKLIRLSDNKVMKKGELNDDDVLPIRQAHSKIDSLYMFPLKGYKNILERIFYDPELSFWTENMSNEEIEIWIKDFEKTERLKVNNFSLLGDKDEVKSNWRLTTTEAESTISINIENIKLNFFSTYIFINIKGDYYLKSKKIQIR
jgi:hypothetical protein